MQNFIFMLCYNVYIALFSVISACNLQNNTPKSQFSLDKYFFQVHLINLFL